MCNLLTPYAIELFEPIAKWLAIGVVGLFVLASICVLIMRKENFLDFAKKALFALFVFLLALGLTCLIMEIGKKYSQSYADENGIDPKTIATYILLPITLILLSTLATAIATVVVNKTAKPENLKKATKKTLTICGAIMLASLVFSGVMLAVYYEQVKDWYQANPTILYIACALLILVLIGLAFILDKNDKPFDTRCIAMAGITVAMSFGLSYIKLFEMPQGGSITLISLLPVMIFSYVYGTKKGVLVCFIYGVLQAIQDPWLIHPAQFLLDYPVAFSAIGLSGAFANFKPLAKVPQVSFLLGGILGGSFRFVSHVLSGVFAFSTYAGELNPWIYSLGYNSFVFIDIAIAIVAGVLVFSSKTFLRELKK